MLHLLRMLATAPAVVVAVPALSAPVTSTSNAGTCPGPSSSAQFHFGWSETSVDRALHRVDVYSGGVLVQAGAASTGYTETITGWTVTGPTGRMTFTRDYEARLVRLSDNAVLSTATSATYMTDLGTC